MNLCADNHNEICFDGRTCPLCEAMGEIKELENEVVNLQKELLEVINERTGN